MESAAVALMLSGAAGAVGLYGAVTAHRALRWQRRRDTERRQPRVRVEVEHWLGSDYRRYVRDALEAGQQPHEHSDGHGVAISVINDSEQGAVYVQNVLLNEACDEPSSAYLIFEEERRLEPRQRITQSVILEDPYDMNFTNGFVAEAQLASGERFVSQLQLRDPFRMRFAEERRSRAAP
jgi:hypothetical protein